MELLARLDSNELPNPFQLETQGAPAHQQPAESDRAVLASHRMLHGQSQSSECSTLPLGNGTAADESDRVLEGLEGDLDFFEDLGLDLGASSDFEVDFEEEDLFERVWQTADGSAPQAQAQAQEGELLMATELLALPLLDESLNRQAEDY